MNTEDSDEVLKLKQQIAQMSDLLEAKKIADRLPKNMDFVQVSRAELRSIGDLGAKSQLALDLLMIFAQAMDKKNAVMMSYKAMESITGKSDRQLRRALSVLKNDNWIQIIKVGTANVYVLNSAVFWTDKGHKKQLANFTAQIITTLEEQNKDLRSSPNISLRKLPTLIKKRERIILGNDELPPPDQNDLELN